MKSESLHGNAPDTCPVALLLIDVINDLEFEGGAELLPRAVAMGKALRKLTVRSRRAHIPVVYVNDNFGRWRSDFRALVEHCSQTTVRGAPLARLMTPHRTDYFVLKPKASGFYATSLQILLEHLKARTLILAGLTTHMCVQFTATDAYLRDYALVVPSDCVAAGGPDEHEQGLQHLSRVLKADVLPSDDIDLQTLKTARPARRK